MEIIYLTGKARLNHSNSRQAGEIALGLVFGLALFFVCFSAWNNRIWFPSLRLSVPSEIHRQMMERRSFRESIDIPHIEIKKENDRLIGIPQRQGLTSERRKNDNFVKNTWPDGNGTNGGCWYWSCPSRIVKPMILQITGQRIKWDMGVHLSSKASMAANDLYFRLPLAFQPIREVGLMSSKRWVSRVNAEIAAVSKSHRASGNVSATFSGHGGLAHFHKLSVIDAVNENTDPNTEHGHEQREFFIRRHFAGGFPEGFWLVLDWTVVLVGGVILYVGFVLIGWTEHWIIGLVCVGFGVSCIAHSAHRIVGRV